MNTVTAPWTDEQVENLNAWQRAGHVHPFTCGRCRDELGTHFIRRGEELVPMPDDMVIPAPPITVDDLVSIDRILIATTDGWVCETCDYTQDWCFDMMLGPVPPSPFAGLVR